MRVILDEFFVLNSYLSNCFILVRAVDSGMLGEFTPDWYASPLQDTMYTLIHTCRQFSVTRLLINMEGGNQGTQMKTHVNVHNCTRTVTPLPLNMLLCSFNVSDEHMRLDRISHLEFVQNCKTHIKHYRNSNCY